MRTISLYIGGQPVDIDKQTLIQMTYTMEDLTNPTIVKNAYSQKVKLKGTAQNNRIFGSMFRLDRKTISGGGVGNEFSPVRKTPFAIYDDMGNILERGYIKLEDVTRKGADVEYQVTLYGGLGEFFYELSYREDGEKKTLADLDFFGSENPDEELDFRINATAVQNAWDHLESGDVNRRWDVINFAPMYNGIPEDFSADVGLLRPADMGVTDTVTEDGVQYTTYNGYAKVDLGEEYDEWQVKDLRSYLQRPVYSIKAIIEAMCEPRNNGGHTVYLDPDFFNNNNPYWANAWATLPILNTIEREVKSETAPLVFGWSDTIMQGSSLFENTINKEGGRSTIKVSLIPKAVSSYNKGRLSLWGHISFTVLVVGFDGQTIASEPKAIGDEALFIRNSNGEWVWDGDPIELSINDADNVKIVVLRVDVESLRMEDVDAEVDEDVVYVDGFEVIQNSTIDFIPYKTARTGALITKKMLFESDKTPADYLLSYAKLFGLHFIYDKATKNIEIRTRNKIYTGDSIDLTDRIDRSQQIKIQPFTFDSKWYDMGFEYEEGAFAEYYNDTNGKVYGIKRIDTGWPFNSETKHLLDGNAFVGGVEVSKRDVHLVNLYDVPNSHFPNQRTFIPSPFIAGSLKMTLRSFSGEDTEIDVYKAWNTVQYWNDVYKTYDIVPKLQMHDNDGGAIDTRDVLLFLREVKSAKNYGFGAYSELRLTDDSSIMGALNDGEPCWILNGGTKVGAFPSFGRYIYDQRGIIASWDFGVPAELDIPDMAHDADAPIYPKAWAKYLADRYDVDSKVVTCKVDLRGIEVGIDLLRKFFYFDNAWWVLNKVSNYNLTGHAPVDCEFVKVKNRNNYSNGQIWQ